MKKKLIALAMGLALAAAMTACGNANQQGGAGSEATTQQAAEAATEVAVEVNSDEEGTEVWYEKVLKDGSTVGEYTYYAAQDINNDGIDELFLSTKEDARISADDKACLMANVDGEVKTLAEIGGAGGEFWLYSMPDNVLSHYYRLSGEEDITLARFENGELKEIGTAHYYAPHHSPDVDNEEDIYLIDDKEVSKEEFDSYMEQYGNEAGAITYQAITAK